MAVRPLRAFLDRFRRGIAVPAVVGDDLAAELAPVFASLARYESEAEEVRRTYAERAEKRLGEGRKQAARISASWRAEADAERTRAALARRRQSHEQAVVIEAEGRVEADRIREAAAGRIPDLVAEIVACVEKGGP